MDPIKTLLDDHSRIEESLGRLDVLLQTLEQTVPEIAGILTGLRTELDGHTFREECLFPLLASRVGVTGGPVQAVEHDHEQVEQDLAAAETAVDSCCGGRNAEAEVLTTGRALVRELRAHFAREESHLFPLAAKLLNGSELRVVAEQMESES